MSFDLREILPEGTVRSEVLTRREREVLAGICSRVEWMLRKYCDIEAVLDSVSPGDIVGPCVEVVVDVGGEECRILLTDTLILRLTAALVRSEVVDERVLTALGFLVTEVLADVLLRRPAALVDIRREAQGERCSVIIAAAGGPIGVLLSEDLRTQLARYAQFERPESLKVLEAVGVPCVVQLYISWGDLVGLLSGRAVEISTAAPGRLAAGTFSIDGVNFIFPEER